MDAGIPVDAKNAPTAIWRTVQNAVSHSAHTHHCVGMKKREDRRDDANQSVHRFGSGPPRSKNPRKVAVSDPTTFEGLTQFRSPTSRASPQPFGTMRHVKSDMPEGGFCAILILAARKSLILNGEMSEWLKEHAWK